MEKNQNNEVKNKLEKNSLEKYLFVENNGAKRVINKEKLLETIKQRFKNRLSCHLIDYGKILYYTEKDKMLENKVCLESSDLEYIKAKESLTRKIATVISFSTYSFYNIFNHESIGDFEDILQAKDAVIEKIKNKKIAFNEKKLNYFFDEKKLEEDINKNEFIGEISESIYNFRNAVTHFKPLEILQISLSETIKYYEKIINQDYLNKRVTEKFSSNNLYEYYSKGDLESYFNIYKYRLIKTKVPFAPNFKRVLKKGENLYRNKIENRDKYKNIINYKSLYSSFWDLENLEEIEKLKEYKRAKDFLLSELYYNNFYSDFLSNSENSRKIFKEAVVRAKQVKEYNCKYSDTKKDRYGNFSKLGDSGLAYQIIKNYNPSNSIEEYIANIHKEEMNRIEKNEKYNTEEIKGKADYLNEFLEDVFLEGFILWLKGKKLSILFTKTRLLEKPEIDKDTFENMINGKDLIIDRKKLELERNEHKLLNEESIRKIQLYLMLSMQDNKRINELENEIVKFKQYQKLIEGDFFGIKFVDYSVICQLILLSRERLNSKDSGVEAQNMFGSFYENTLEYDEVLKRFIDDKIIEDDRKDKANQKYYQTDGVTPILHRNLEGTRKFGTQDFISKIVLKYIEKDKNDYQKLQSEIGGDQEKKAKLHKKWTENKIETNSRKEYLDTCEKIRKYNYLEHKQSLQNVYELHKILSDIQGRFIAFINKYERDFKFIMFAIEKLTPDNVLKEKINLFLEPKGDKKLLETESITTKNTIIGKVFKLGDYSKMFSESNIHKNLIKIVFNPEGSNGNIRDYISHFNHFTQFEGKKSESSFIDQMNSLIDLFRYDKKIKNHINKSIKTILEKYNMEIQFELEDEQISLDKYKISKIVSKKGKMLGKNEFEILEGEFTTTVRNLLTYRSHN